ncbi:MAG: hypothetical protein AB1422_16265 [bacterium]
MKKRFRLTQQTLYSALSGTNELDELINKKPIIEFSDDLSEFKIEEENIRIKECIPAFFYQISTNSEKSIFLPEKKLSKDTISLQPIFNPIRFKSGFVGENLTLEKYSSLDEDEKIHLQTTLWEKNGEWLTNKFEELNAAWVTVINGEIETFSSDIDEYPQRGDILDMCQKRGKFPFIFINKTLLTIEESSSKWTKTKYIDDYYPTVEIQAISSNSTLNIIADFDTGTSDLFVDMARLISEGLIASPFPEEVPDTDEHLGENYRFYTKHLCVGIVSERGKIKKVKDFSVYCIRNWGKSPFVKINPNRSALVGRRLFLKIGYSVHLHFSNRKTEIY